jgi:hypothetical protein
MMKTSLSLLAVLTQLVASAPTGNTVSGAKESSSIPFPPLDYTPHKKFVPFLGKRV